MTFATVIAPAKQWVHLLGYGLKRCAVNQLLVLGLMCFGASGALAADGAKVILALGDSLTAGYGLEQTDAFPVQLEAALKKAGHDVRVLNGGVSGDTTAGGRSRLAWLLTAEIDAVIVSLGANDGLRGLDPGQTRDNLDWILATLKQRGIPTLLSGMYAPPNLGKDYGAEFNAIYPDLAQKYGTAFDPFFLEGVAAIPALNQDDGIHPNRQGVAIIVERLVPLIETLLETK